jgi:integrase/recombinase XerD
MSSVLVIFKKDKKKINGESPLFIRLTKNRSSAFISLDIWVKEDLWDEKNKRVKVKFPNSGRANSHIAAMLSRAQSKMLELCDPTIPISDIKKALTIKKTG